MQNSKNVDRSGYRPGTRGYLPLRVAPMLLVGLILMVLGVLSTTAF
mgnify:CR=1 FL=1